MLTPGTNPSSELAERLRPFLKERGITGNYQITSLPGGANNRVFQLTHPSGIWVVKSYFQNPDDPRDRFGTERAFYELLWPQGVRSIPEPLGWLPELRIGLFEHLGGRRLIEGEVNRERINQALAFVVELNQCRSTAASHCLPVASEACFSVTEHLAVVDRRVAQLLKIEPASDVEIAAVNLVQTELLPAWRRTASAIQQQTKTAPAEPLPGPARCLSPSDFGFHNALLGADGQLRFFDFEYAGWDDPAKLVCDFFCQPQLPVALAEWDHVVGTLATALRSTEPWATRARQLLPAYQIKWCCIMLNDFLRPSRARREFAGQGERQTAQFAKARAAMRSLTQAQGCRP